MATMSLRLDAETVSLVDSIARRMGFSMSEVIRAAIKEYARSVGKDSGESFYVGRWESGDPYLSTRTAEEISQMMPEERQRRDLDRHLTTRRAG